MGLGQFRAKFRVQGSGGVGFRELEFIRSRSQGHCTE